MSNAIRLLQNLEMYGATIRFAQNNADFPASPGLGQLAFVDGILYIWTAIGSVSSWYPLTTKNSTYVHTQAIAALTWNVTHNLDSEDVIFFVYDTSNTLITAQISNMTANSFDVNFTSSTIGRCIVFATGVALATPSGGGGGGVSLPIAISDVTGLASAINSEITSRTGADATLTASVLAEVTSRTAGDATNAAAILAEVTNRTAADLAEVTARTAADATLQGNINAEITARTAGDATNAAAVLTEATARAAADALKADLAGSVSQDFSVNGLTANGSILPVTDSVSDLGSASKYFANLYVDSVITTQPASILAINGTEYSETSGAVTRSTAGTSTLDSFSATMYRSAEVVVQVTQGSNYEVVKLMLVHNGSTVSLTEYGRISIGSDTTVTFDAAISGGNVNITATLVNATSTTVKFKRAALTV